MDVQSEDEEEATVQRKTVCSYGISIDTSEIASVASDRRGDDLEELDIDVYEQEEFEEGILSQMDHALTSAETNFKHNLVKKQIEEVETEIR